MDEEELAKTASLANHMLMYRVTKHGLASELQVPRSNPDKAVMYQLLDQTMERIGIARQAEDLLSITRKCVAEKIPYSLNQYQLVTLISQNYARAGEFLCGAFVGTSGLLHTDKLYEHVPVIGLAARGVFEYRDDHIAQSMGSMLTRMSEDVAASSRDNKEQLLRELNDTIQEIRLHERTALWSTLQRIRAR
jgi:hypothetical protein